MGLDITIRHCTDFDAALATADEADKMISALYEDKSLTEKQRDEKRKEIAERMGTDEWGSPKGIKDVEGTSTIDPGHMFTLGYFRSSYNDGGINNVMRRLGLPGLYEIFGADDSRDYYIKVDWAQSLVRAEQAIAGYEAHLNGPAGAYEVMELRPMFEYGVKTAREALDLFMGEMQRENVANFSDYSNRDGEFHLKGMTVRAIITKKFERDASGNPLSAFLNRPSVFVVFDKQGEKPADCAGAAPKDDWYLTALKIVREAIQNVLAQPDPQNYRLAWSS